MNSEKECAVICVDLLQKPLPSSQSARFSNFFFWIFGLFWTEKPKFKKQISGKMSMIIVLRWCFERLATVDGGKNSEGGVCGHVRWFAMSLALKASAIHSVRRLDRQDRKWIKGFTFLLAKCFWWQIVTLTEMTQKSLIASHYWTRYRGVWGVWRSEILSFKRI